jgi:UDP-glucose 4-epimerase
VSTTSALYSNVVVALIKSCFAGNCTNPYGKTKFFMEEIMKDVVAANPDWGCQLLR